MRQMLMSLGFLFYEDNSSSPSLDWVVLVSDIMLSKLLVAVLGSGLGTLSVLLLPFALLLSSLSCRESNPLPASIETGEKLLVVEEPLLPHGTGEERCEVEGKNP